MGGRESRSVLPLAASGRRRIAVMVGALAGIATVGVVVAQSAYGTSSASCNIAPLQSRLKAAMSVPKFVPPGPAFDAKKAKGKSVMSIPQDARIPFNEGNEAAMAAVSKLVGVKFKQYVNQGSPAQYVQGMQQAIANGTDGIDLFGADPRQVKPQIAQAKAKGIVVQASQTYDNRQVAEEKAKLKVDAVNTWPYTEAGTLMADWIIADSKCKANVALIYDPGDVPASAVLVAAVKGQFKRYCPQCKVSDNLVSVFDWSTKLQGVAQTALVRDPGINYMMPIYDPMDQFVVPAIQAAGKAGKVKVVACGGIPAALKQIQTGNVVAVDAATSATWEGYAVMDNMLRLLTGHKPLTRQNYPIRLITKENVSEAIPDVDKAFGNAFVTGYKKLWKLK